jgi:hypothetical protein
MSSPQWRVELHKAVVDYLLANGTPMEPGDRDRFYGYVSPNWEQIRERVAIEGVDYDRTTWDSSEWDEFKDTFYEGDTRTVGIDVKGYLNDGTPIEYRWSGQPGELLLAIIRGD